MITKNLCFPSGVSVTQAKKDAKQLARSLDIPHHLALDKTAKKLGFPQGWTYAMSSLNRQLDELLSVELPLRSGGYHRVAITCKAPFITIIGPPGSGKSVLTMMLAKQALAQFREVHYVSISASGKDSNDLPNDLAVRMARQLNSDAAFKLHLHSDAREILFQSLPKPKGGGVLILDEGEYIAGWPRSIAALKEWQAELDCAVILCSQGHDAFRPIDASAPEVGLGLFGSMNNDNEDAIKTPGVIELASRLTTTLTCREFVAAVPEDNWLDVTRIELHPGQF